MSNFETPKWKIPEYSRKEIERAGKSIKNEHSSEDERLQALAVVDNWRSAHAYPLHVIYMYFHRNTNSNVIVAQRLKRLDSIIKKLQRFPEMNLWRMQDLGGCRVILTSNDELYSMADTYESSRKRHVLKNVSDYIENPQTSGYRSLHYVYEYKSDDKKSAYNRNMMIEVQFRTQLQHLWATAVETMGIFTNQALKSGAGDDDVKRFFVLISSLFAIEEIKPIVPNTVNDIDQLVNEIETLNSKHNFLDILSAIKVAINNQEQLNNLNKPGFFLLILNYHTHLLHVRYFKPSQSEEANNIYDNIEKTRQASSIDVVLVRVESFKTLKRAYPNYFYDISSFIEKVKSYLG